MQFLKGCFPFTVPRELWVYSRVAQYILEPVLHRTVYASPPPPHMVTPPPLSPLVTTS